jgi:hypothetical protein
MARINIEDKLFADGRFAILKAMIGEAEAIGKLVIAWRTAQSYWKQDELIPHRFWEILKLDELIETDFAVSRDDGVYVRGTEEHFEWLKLKQEAGKKGGAASAESRKTKQNSSRNEALVESCLDSASGKTQAEIKPLSLSLSLPLNNKIKPEEIIALFNKILAGKGKIKRFNFQTFGGQHLADFINCTGHAGFTELAQWESYFNIVASRPKLLNYPASIWFLVKYENATNILSGGWEDNDQQPKTNLNANQAAQAMSSKIFDGVIKAGSHGLKEFLSNLCETEKKAIDLFGRASEILSCTDFQSTEIKTRLKNACVEAMKEHVPKAG